MKKVEILRESTEVKDYPYGRLRTTAKFGLEKDPKKGYRTTFQTINPKTARVNAPKKSTYSDFIIMYRNENNHVKYFVWNLRTEKDFLSLFAVAKAQGYNFTKEEFEYIKSKALVNQIMSAKATLQYTYNTFDKNRESEEFLKALEFIHANQSEAFVLLREFKAIEKVRNSTTPQELNKTLEGVKELDIFEFEKELKKNLPNLKKEVSKIKASNEQKAPVVKKPVVKKPVIKKPVVKKPVEKKEEMKKENPAEKKEVRTKDILKSYYGKGFRNCYEFIGSKEMDAKEIAKEIQDFFNKKNSPTRKTMPQIGLAYAELFLGVILVFNKSMLYASDENNIKEIVSILSKKRVSVYVGTIDKEGNHTMKELTEQKPVVKKPVVKKPVVKKPVVKKPIVKAPVVKTTVKTATKNRTSVKGLLKSNDAKDIRLGIVYKMVEVLRANEKLDKDKKSISNQMNVIKRALLKTPKHHEVIEKKITKALAVSSLENKLTTTTKKVFNEIYDAVKIDGFTNVGGANRVKEKENIKSNALSVLFGK